MCWVICRNFWRVDISGFCIVDNSFDVIHGGASCSDEKLQKKKAGWAKSNLTESDACGPGETAAGLGDVISLLEEEKEKRKEKNGLYPLRPYQKL